MDDLKKIIEKKQKKKKTSAKLDEIDATLQKYYSKMPSPTLKDTLPYRILIWLFSFIVTTLPCLLKNSIRGNTKTKWEEKLTDESIVKTFAEKEYLKRRTQKQFEASRLSKELNPTKIELSNNVNPVISYSLVRSQNSEFDNVEQKKSDIHTIKEWTDKQKLDLIKVFVF